MKWDARRFRSGFAAETEDQNVGKNNRTAERVYIVSSGTAVGHEENAGPLGGKFDVADTEDDRFGMDSYEKSEAQMQKVALEYAIKKAGLCEDDVEVIFAGDLLNQCVSSAYAYAENEIPFLGLFAPAPRRRRGF